jgi:ABC-type Fe3+-siderophore transport system permease subunit
MSRWVDAQSHVGPPARLIGSLVAGLIIAAVGGMMLGEYTFQGKGIQWLAISGGAGMGAAIAWVLNRVWAHEPPLWMAGVAAALAVAGEALAVHLDNEDRAWPAEGWVAIVLAAGAAAYGIYSAHKLAAENRNKQT